MARRTLTLVAVVLAAVAACTATESAEVIESDYIEMMDAACAVTSGELAALPTPPGDISTPDFATLAATAIGNEAERARTIEPPDDLAADHRAFVANTDDQASRWREIAEISADDEAELNRLSSEIAQLTLGRDDLATEMGIVACRRAAE
jgi:HAMP domain-containing protein